MIHREPKDPIPSAPSIAEIRSIYEGHTSREHVLKRGDKQMLHVGVPLAGMDEGFKPQGEVLDNVLIVGDVAVGVMRTHGSNGAVESVRIAVLPIGEAAGDATYNQSSSTIAKIDTDVLSKPRGSGVVQGWEEIRIGRTGLQDRAGVRDNTISRDHLTLMVLADGTVGVEDTSSNGTTIVSAGDLMKHESMGGLPDNARLRIADFIEPLEKKPHLWKEAFADTKVIDPQV